jgi:hypothetical protein
MLSSHFAFLLVSALTILHLPLLLVRSAFPAKAVQQLLDVFGANLLLLTFIGFYAVSQWEAGRFTVRRLALLPLSLGLGMALMVNSCRATLEALFGVRSGFVRTPKEGDRPSKSYKANAAVGQAVVEVAFGLYLLFSCAVLVARGHFWGAPLNLLVAGGFLTLGLGTLRNHWRHRAARQPASQPAPELA